MNNHTEETYTLHHLSGNDFTAELYKRYGKKLYSYAVYSWKLDEDAAWDLIYKTLYKVIDSYKKYQFETEEKFASFIFKIFINYLRNNYQERKKITDAVQITRIDSSELQNKAETITEKDLPGIKQSILNEELDKMEDWQKILLLMRSEGRPYSEIAVFINKPVDHLKVYYQRFKEQLTKKINERL